jgi:hypothetical protein
MPKNRIVLQDGTIDLSGDYIAYVDRLISDDKVLPYTVKEVMEAPPPRGFIKLLESDFTETKTAEALIYYLSLIPAMETDFRLGGIFYGGANTGKTAILEIMREVFPGYFVNLPPEAFITKRGGTIDHYSPYIADLENRGAGIAQDFPADCKINVSLWKVLTGGDTITARRRYQEPHNFIPTAQIIIVTNHILSFPDNDDAVKDRVLLFPFLKRHDRGEGVTKTISEIALELKPEFPGIVHLMAAWYVHLKRKLGGKIPQSLECRLWKKNFFKARGTDAAALAEEALKDERDTRPPMPELTSKTIDGVKTIVILPESMDFFFCESCNEFFSNSEVLIENGQSHCPHCGAVVVQAKAHVSRRNKAEPGEIGK